MRRVFVSHALKHSKENLSRTLSRAVNPIAVHFAQQSGLSTSKDRVCTQHAAVHSISKNEETQLPFGSISPEAERIKLRMFEELTTPSHEDEKSSKPYIRLSGYERAHPQVWYETKLSKLVGAGKVQEAEEFFITKMMGEDRMKPSPYMFSLMLTAHAKHGNLEKTFHWFNKMKKMGMYPKPSGYASLFTVCKRAQNRDKARLQAKFLLAEIQHKNMEWNPKMLESAVLAFAFHGETKLAFQLADESASFSAKEHTRLFGPLLTACRHDKQAGFQLALAVWKTMRKKAAQIETFHYNQLLLCLNECGVKDKQTLRQLIVKSEATTSTEPNSVIDNPRITPEDTDEEEILQTEINHSDISPLDKVDGVNVISDLQNTLNTYKSTDLLHAKGKLPSGTALLELQEPYERLLLLGGVDGVLKRMRWHSCLPDIVTFTQLLKTLPPSTFSENHLIHLMEEWQVKPSGKFFEILLSRRARRGDMEQMSPVVFKIKELEISMTRIMYNTLALACEDAASATLLLEEMERDGHCPSRYTYHALLSNSPIMPELLVVLMKSMLRKNFKPEADLSDWMYDLISEWKSQLVQQEKYSQKQQKLSLQLDNGAKINADSLKDCEMIYYELRHSKQREHNSNR